MIEWILHSKVMHGNPTSIKKIPFIGKLLSKTAQDHLNHHNEVNMDMTMSHVNENANGLIFTWATTFIVTLVLYGSNNLLFKLTDTQISSKNKILYAVITGVLYSMIWNTIHVNMHNVQYKVKAKQGILNFKPSKNHNNLYKYLWQYHAIHHLQKGGKKNFNIVLPGFDWLMGTYQNKCFDNTKYCMENKADHRCKIRQHDCLTNNEIM